MRTEARTRFMAFVLGAVPAATLALAYPLAHAQVATSACGGDFEAALASLVAMPPATMSPVDVYNAAWLRRMLGDPALLPAEVPALDGEVIGACSGRRLAARVAELWPAFAGGSLAPEPIRVVALERAVAQAVPSPAPPPAPPAASAPPPAPPPPAAPSAPASLPIVAPPPVAPPPVALATPNPPPTPLVPAPPPAAMRPPPPPPAAIIPPPGPPPPPSSSSPPRPTVAAPASPAAPAQPRPEAPAATSSRDATPRQPAPRAAERGRKPAPVVLLGAHQTRERAEAAMGRLREALGPEVGARLLIDGKAPRLRILLSDTEPLARCEELKARGVACSFLYPAADGSLR